MRAAYVGIDVAFAKKKRLPVAICTREEKRIVPLPLTCSVHRPPRGAGNAAILDDDVVKIFTVEAREYIVKVCREFDVEPVRIAIDAPSAPCVDGRRAAEAALSAAGISCFATPTNEGFNSIRQRVKTHLTDGGAESRIPHSNQLWMITGFALFDALREVAECIEIYPQATARALGVGAVHKSKQGAVEAQLAAAASHTGWPIGRAGDPSFEAIAHGAAHDKLDAYFAAWVASLDEPERTAFGTPPDDAIWVPRLGAAGAFARSDVAAMMFPAAPRTRQPRVTAPTRSPNEHTRPCPACGAYQFARWPWGWDAHAAHSCPGLSGTDPADRKREYRNRFADHFRR